MQSLIHLLRQVLSPLPPPWRLVVAMITIVVLVWQVGPFLLSAVSRLTSRAVEPLVGALVLPEYTLTSWLRDKQRRPLPGTYSYGRALELAAQGTRAVMLRVHQQLGQRRRVSPRIIVILTVVPVVAFYAETALPATGAPRPIVCVVRGVQGVFVSMDGLIMTGQPRSADSIGSQNGLAPSSWCAAQ